VRASATSKISSAAGYAAAQAKPNAAPADQASPFALLVDKVATKDAVRDRPSQKDTSNTADKGADDKPAKAQDNHDTATQTAASEPAKTKPEKSDKSPDKIKASDDSDPQASDPQTQDQGFQQAVTTMDQQTVPPPPPVTQTAVPADGESDDLAVDAAAALNPQTDIKASANGKAEAKPGLKADTRTGAPAQAPVKPAVTAELPAVTDDSGEEAADTQIAEPASQAAPAAAKAAAPVQTAANIQTNAATGGKDVHSRDAKNTDVPAQDQAQGAAPADIAPKDNATKTDNADPLAAGKSSGVKNAALKSRAVQTDTTDKGDAAKSDQAKNDTSNTAAPQIDVPNVASAPKATPQPAAQAIFAINSIAAPQAAQSSPVASATANAHVQVSAQPAPNLPALAVEIVGRSKSGTKQFDIRLDPPELGRVEVRLSIDATGKASAHLSADQPQTLSLLQKDAPVLTRALREAGLDVSQDGLNFSLRQQNENSSGNTGNNGRRGSARSFPLSASVSIEAGAGSAAYRAAADGRLDIRV
jgi:flagellar hook-length control protein FliK